jgi:hypothetical protein
MKQEDLLAFNDSLSKTASPKEQKQHMRNLLLLATGSKLRALASQKTTNVITNVTSEWTESHFFQFSVLHNVFMSKQGNIAPILFSICIYLLLKIGFH